MKIYEGNLSLIGAGTWKDGIGGGGTRHTVIDIGSDSIKGVVLPDYLRNYVRVGEHVRILVFHTFMGKLISATEVNGKKYKLGLGLILILQLLLFAVSVLVIYGILGAMMGHSTFAVIICALLAAKLIKDISDFMTF